MKNTKNTKNAAASIALMMALLSGCSTVVNGKTQKIHVSSAITTGVLSERPVDNDTGHDTGHGTDNDTDNDCTVIDSTGVVPVVHNTAIVKRSSKELIIRCNEKITVHKPSLTKEAITSIMFIDFGIIDFLTGAAWGYDVK